MPLTQRNTSDPITLDHAAHFVPDMDAATAALIELGFTLTPYSAQSHRPAAGAPLTPAGTANRCAMLQQGYLEVLTPTHDTPNARQLRDAIARYTGVHLIAFGTTTPEADHARLMREGFAPLPPIDLQRETSTASTTGTPGGTTTVRFTVVRVAPATMAEGRIQYCQHHTPDAVWQSRWLTHRNHAVGLAGMLLCVADAAEAAHRYARFTGLSPQAAGNAWRIDTARGYLWFCDAATLQRELGLIAPVLPWIAGCVVDSDDLPATRACVGGQALGERVYLPLPPALGGVMIFQQAGSPVLNLVE
jgi:Glyoxalase-like domain